jgi:hypothetical protein
VVQSIAIHHCYQSLVDGFNIGNVGGLDTGETRVFWGPKCRILSILPSVGFGGFS